MQAEPVLTAWDTAVLAVPLVGLLAFWMFGLDERAAAPRARAGRHRFGHVQFRGKMYLVDPDGTICSAPEPESAVPEGSAPVANRCRPRARKNEQTNEFFHNRRSTHTA